MTIFYLPDLGEGLHEATLEKWHVKIGDHICVDQPLLLVETAKSVVEIPSPFSGTVDAIMAKEGQRIATKSALIKIKDDPERIPSVVGILPQTEKELHDHPPLTPKASDHNIPPAMPAVRHLANLLNLSLNHTQGNGPNGLIQSEDLLQSFTKQKDPMLQNNRQAMAHAISQATNATFCATLQDGFILDDFNKKSLTLWSVQACVAACQTVSSVNAHYHPHHTYKQHSPVHLALAVQSKHGLFTPVIKDAHLCDNETLLSKIDHFKQQANNNTLKPSSLTGATFTLSNIGAIGGQFGTPILLPPCVGIMSIGRATPQLGLNKQGNLSQQIMLPLSLTFDHRVVSGSDAALFINAFKTAFLKHASVQ